MHGFSKRVLLFVFWLDASRQLSSHTKGQNSYDLPSSLQSCTSCRPLTCVRDHSYTCELIRMWVWVMSHSVIYVQKTHLRCQGFQVCSVNKFTSCNFRPIESNLLGYHGNVTSVRHKGVLSSFGKMVKRLKRPKSCDDRNMHSVDDGIKASECRLYSKNVTESGRKSKCKLGNKSVHTCESLRSSTEVNPNPPPPMSVFASIRSWSASWGVLESIPDVRARPWTGRQYTDGRSDPSHTLKGQLRVSNRINVLFLDPHRQTPSELVLSTKKYLFQLTLEKYFHFSPELFLFICYSSLHFFPIGLGWFT